MKTLLHTAALALIAAALVGCTTTADSDAAAWPATSDPASPASWAPVEPDRMSELTRVLSSDTFEGRAPGTQGERRTVEWLIGQFAALGLQPGGENGGWTQRVPLIRTQVETPARFTVRSHGETLTLRSPQDIYLSTVRPAEQARIENAPMVFVGYGVSAPERQWDDFKGLDLTGKVAVFLVNDPDFEAEAGSPAAGRFGGQAMTYYGRWSYKFEEAARRGAIAALVVHETEAAGYGWNTVEAPAGENYNVVLPAGSAQPVLLQGWIQWNAAADLLRRAGHDLEAVKRQARTAAFRPIDLGATFSADLPVEVERVESQNVLARLPGATRPDESVMYAVHWDAYGIGPPDAQGDRIRHGAADDALGTAAMLEVARLFAAGPRPDRSVVFAAWTAEERGLLGSEYYARNPIYPIETTVANITLDTLQTAGAARDVILIGEGQSEMEDWLARMAASQGRRVTPDARPERGLFYRADHFSLAKRGVPVLLLMALGGGADLVDGGREAGDAWVTRFTTDCYHQPCDAWSPDWDRRGAAQDASLAWRIGRELAFSQAWPQWRSGSEFRAVREESATQRR